MASSWDFVQAMSALRSPTQSHVNSTEPKSPVPSCVSGPNGNWSFESILSALHADVNKWRLRKPGKKAPSDVFFNLPSFIPQKALLSYWQIPDKKILDLPDKQLTPEQFSALGFVPSQLGKSDIRKENVRKEDIRNEDHDEPLVLPEITYSTSKAWTKVVSKLKTAEERRDSLMAKLASDFPEYARHLETGRRYAGTKTIHVFVDMSNILIGFHELAKNLRNIPSNTRVPRIPFSFTNFSLILERGRHTSKRVLAGSDRSSSIEEAGDIGYETNILQRVKAKPQTTYSRAPHTSLEKIDGSSSSTSMAESWAESCGGRWVEQGVDEILHLKMLESLIDAEKPATIVLATGDAAKAEYSGGFLSMVERALRRGWKVELVSFSHLTSWAYKNKDFRDKWGAQFEVIPLDYFVEELFR